MFCNVRILKIIYMIIELKKFGTTLTSRDDGKGAYNAIQVLLRSLKNKEELIIDFKDVYAFSPSWGDEFLTNLYKKYKNRLVLLNTEKSISNCNVRYTDRNKQYKFYNKKAT